ncbi:MAG: hypothetical protein AAFU79_18265 [Myxococcota bacterium]
MRLARAIASDIALYNEDKIIRGIEQDNLFETLEEELAEGLSLYQSRVASEIETSTNYFHRAVVDEVLKRKGHIKSKIW